MKRRRNPNFAPNNMNVIGAAAGVAVSFLVPQKEEAAFLMSINQAVPSSLHLDPKLESAALGAGIGYLLGSLLGQK